MYLEMRRFRSSITFLLVAVLVLTTQSMAGARGAAMSAGQIVLCTGTGPVTVNADKKGQPVGPAHICPDCALSELVAAYAPALSPAEPLAISELQWSRQTITVINALRHPASARDPPLG